MANSKQISDRLQQWIKSTGLRKSQIAEQLGISAAQLSQLLSGRDSFGKVMQERLRLIGADTDWILTGRSDFNNGAERGSMIASYFFADLKDVVIDKECKEDGVYVKIYKIATKIDEDYVPKIDLRLVADRIEEYVEIKQEVIPAPVPKVVAAAATSIHKHTKE